MFKLNGVPKPEWLSIKDIKRPLFPTISQNTVSVRRRAGALNYGNNIEQRTFEFEYILKKERTEAELMEKIRLLQDYLYSEEPMVLTFDDKPTIGYKVVLSGDTELDEILTYGFGSFSLVAYEPYGFALNENNTILSPLGEEGTAFINTGQLDTKGQLELTFKENTTGLTIINGDNSMVFGDLDVDKTPVDTKPVRFHDDCSSGAGWTTASSTINGTIISNQFVSNGFSIKPQSWGDPEEVGGWRNITGIKSLGKQLQDFQMEAVIGIHSTEVGQLGRIQLYGLSTEGERVFAISIRQGDPSAVALFGEFWVGNRKLWEGWGDYKGAWKDLADGVLMVARRGKQWTCYIAAKGANGKDHTRMTRLFTITDLPLGNRTVASVQLVMSTNRFKPVENIYVADIRFKELLGNATSEQNPVLFKQGDVLLIDSETDGVFLNGQPFYEGLDPSSQFFTIKKGYNQLAVLPSDVVDTVTIKYKERYW